MAEETPTIIENDQVNQPDVGPVHEGPLTTDYMQNTLNEAFLNLPGAGEFLKNLPPETPIEEQQPVKEEKAAEAPEAITVDEDKADVQENPPAQKAQEHTDIVSPDDPEEKRQSTWNRLKKEAKEAAALREQLKDFEGTKAEREALKTQLESIRKETEAIKAEREAMESELYRSRIQAHPKFQEQVIKPFNILKEAAEVIAKENELDSEVLFGAIVRGDKKAMYELTSGLHSYDQTQVFDLFKDMRHVVAARDHLLADSKSAAETFAREQEESSKRYANEISERRNKALNTIVPALAQKVLSVLPESRRKDLDSMRDEVAGFDAWPEEIKMYGGLASVLLPEVLESYQEVQAQLKEAQATISKLRGGTPKVGTKGQPVIPSTTPVKDTTDYSKMTTDSLAEQAVQRMRQSLGL